MLLGEHAVLHGYKALVGAINRRIIVELTPTIDPILRIDSALGIYESSINELADHASFRFVLQAVRQHRSTIPAGLSLNITSEFSADIGFGSSSAVTVAVHAALMKWATGKMPPQRALFDAALETVHTVQGRGSGADLAAAVYGGVVGYTTAPEFFPVELSVPLIAVYCGYKTPTPEVIQRVETLRSENHEKYRRIYSEMDESVERAVAAASCGDLTGFGAVLNRNQILMDEMGVNTAELQDIVAALQESPNVYGAKISGSGLGDCAIGIGVADLSELGYPIYHLEITPVGGMCHE